MSKRKTFADTDFVSDSSSEDEYAVKDPPSKRRKSSTSSSTVSPKSASLSSAPSSASLVPSSRVLGKLSFSLKRTHRNFCPNKSKVFTFYEDSGSGKLDVFASDPSASERFEGCCEALIRCQWLYSFVLETKNRWDENAIAIYPRNPKYAVIKSRVTRKSGKRKVEPIGSEPSAGLCEHRLAKGGFEVVANEKKIFKRKSRIGYFPRQIARVMRRDVDDGVIAFKQDTATQSVAELRSCQLTLVISQIGFQRDVNSELKAIIKPMPKATVDSL